jgi:hypothetical protein
MTREEIARELADLLRRSGQQRLEILRPRGSGPRAYGYCVDAHGEEWSAGDYLREVSQ